MEDRFRPVLHPGAQCRINGDGDLAFEMTARPFIGQPCTVVKRTKAGLILVTLDADPKQSHAFKQRNVDLT